MDDKIAAVLNKLPFVRWDRCSGDVGGVLFVFGWIDREDERSDFALAIFHAGEVWTVTTSSAKHSALICALVFGVEAEHVSCERVRDVLPGLERVVGP